MSIREIFVECAPAIPARCTLSAVVMLLSLGVSAIVLSAHAEAPWSERPEASLRLEVHDGADRILAIGESPQLSVRVDPGAFVAVYAIDAQGAVRWLFPRFWEADGWLEAGRLLRLSEPGLAGEFDATRDPGIVFVQALASPTPFDWRLLGVQPTQRGGWSRDGAPLRVRGDPCEGFNEINRLLFTCWDEAVFVTDAVAFYVGRHFDHPAYLCGVCAGRHRGYHDGWVRVRSHFVSERQSGASYSRRIHQPQYIYCAERRTLGQAGRAVVPRRGATPPEPGSDARNGGRRFRQVEPTVSGGVTIDASLAKLALAARSASKLERAR